MLNKISDNIWTVDGDAVPFFGLPYSTRMTVIRLQNGDLWVHSPLKISNVNIGEIKALGSVKYLVSPNKLHHLFMSEWISSFSDVLSYAPPGLSKKRPDINFTIELGMAPEKNWAKEIKQTIFKGSCVMEEVVFFHEESKTLILADLIENFAPTTFSAWQRVIAKAAGIISPHGKTPIDWRLSFIGGKKEARQSLDTIISWQPENIIISHGECVFGGGVDFLKKSFSWV